MGKYKIALIAAGVIIFLSILAIAYLLYLRSEDKRMLAVKDMRIALLRGDKPEKDEKITGEFSQFIGADTYDTLHLKF